MYYWNILDSYLKPLVKVTFRFELNINLLILIMWRFTVMWSSRPVILLLTCLHRSFDCLLTYKFKSPKVAFLYCPDAGINGWMDFFCVFLFFYCCCDPAAMINKVLLVHYTLMSASDFCYNSERAWLLNTWWVPEGHHYPQLSSTPWIQFFDRWR